MLRLAAMVVPFALASLLGRPSSATDIQTGKLLEATEYSACDYHCAPFNRPTVAYCIQVGDETLVGERTSFLGESSNKSLIDFVGQEVTFRADSKSIRLLVPGQRDVKVKKGSLFERFKENRCIAAVHIPILEAAARELRPSQVPVDAFALAADGETAPLYRWFTCVVNPVDSDIVCKNWDPKGDSRGVDRYCPRTREGTAVDADFEVDHLLSREGRIVLRGEQVLLQDGRGRVNDKLLKPGEACKQAPPVD